mmetsp:Transcript_1127/g.2239  ORF Transcript_1127/g.2239 Transcript_1127/m.2239 type:complete len:134 (-) Transcript_1127:501-902(-)
MLRCVIFDVSDCALPWIVSHDPNVLANLYEFVQLGNESSHERCTDVCRYSPGGSAELNWRMSWWVSLPDAALSARLEEQVYDDTSIGLFNGDRLCPAATDLNMDGALVDREPIAKRKQPVCAAAARGRGCGVL